MPRKVGEVVLAPSLDLENNTAQTCQDLIDTMFAYWDKRDPDGKIAGLYLNMTLSTNPTIAEITSVFHAFLSSATTLPTIAEIRQAIWAERERVRTAAIAGGAVGKMRVDDLTKDLPDHDYEQARQNRIAFLRGIYKQQGDTPYYRKMLVNVAHWRGLGNFKRAHTTPDTPDDAIARQLQTKIPVNHEDVIEGLEVI